MKAALVFNPVAGTRDMTRLVHGAAETMRAGGWQVSVLPTRQPGDMNQLAAQAVRDGAQAVFAAGGDGTVGAVAEALAGSEAVMGVLPVGTANIWALELGLAHRLDTADAVARCVAVQIQAPVRRVDMGRCGDRAFLLWAGIGLDAHVIAGIEPRPWWGKRFGEKYFYVAGLIAAMNIRGANMTVRATSGSVTGRKLLAVVSNVRRYAGASNMLDPLACAADGTMSVWTMDGDHYFHALEQLRRYELARHIGHPKVQSLTGSTIHIKLDRPVQMQFDGELAGRVAEASFDVWRGALRVFVPDPNVPIFQNCHPDLYSGENSPVPTKER